MTEAIKMRTRFFQASTLLGATLVGSTVFAMTYVTTRTKQEPSAPPSVAVDVTPGFSVNNHSILLGDGVRARASASFSSELVDPATNGSVRCLSFFCVFTGRGSGLLGRTTSQRILAADSSESIQIELSGIDPTFDDSSAALFPDAPYHSYLIAISPAPETTWGQISEDEVQIDIVRTE